MSVSVIDLLREIKSKIGNRSFYLYGEAVRDIIDRQKPKKFNIFIKTTSTDKIEELKKSLPVYKNICYTLNNVFSIPEIFTVNMLYLDGEDVLEGNIELLSQHNGLRDYNKSSIKFVKDTPDVISPTHLLDAVTLAVQTGFHLDSKTISQIFTNKESLSTIDKREIYRFLVESVKLRGTRKFISLLNTLGISNVLFGFKLTETSVVNHFNSLDVFEFFAIILSGVNYKDMKNILINKCGVHERDTEHILKLSKAMAEIVDETELSARKFAATIDCKRIPNAVRLLKNIGFKNLAKLVKKEKSNVVVAKDICIDARTIKAVFGIDNQLVVSKLLEIAHQKILSDPEFNNQTKILTYLNQERKKYASKT